MPKRQPKLLKPTDAPPAGKRPTDAVMASNEEFKIGEIVRLGPKRFEVMRRISEFEFFTENEKNQNTKYPASGIATLSQNAATESRVAAKPTKAMKYFYRARFLDLMTSEASEI